MATFISNWSLHIDLLIAKVQGKLFWHKHLKTDDFFSAYQIYFTAYFMIRLVTIEVGELFVTSKGLKYWPIAHSEVYLLLIKPIGTPNTED